MSRYRKVDPRIWNDAKFRTLNNHGKLLFLFLLTHPGMTALGAMRGTQAGLAEELGWELEAFRQAFQGVLDRGMAEHDSKACLIALPKFIKYNQPESPNVIRAWVGALDFLPECELKQTVIYRARDYANAMTESYAEAFAEAFAKAMGNPEQEPKQEQKRNTPPPPKGGAKKKSKAKKTSSRDTPSENFETFWTEWPKNLRKVAKAQCWAKWVTRGCEGIADQVLAALRTIKATEKWREPSGEFVPAPLTWLNQARWEAPTQAEALADHWTESREGIEGKAVELDIGKWDQYAFEHGTGETWPAYEARVRRAAAEEVPA